MKITGIAVAVVGLIILLFVGIMSAQSNPSPGTSGTEPRIDSRDWLTLPMAGVGIAAVVAGGALLVFGGKGYLKTTNPAVRTEV